MSLAYGSVAQPAALEPGPPPPARGPLTEWLFSALARPVHAVVGPSPAALGDPLCDEDAALALYALYELHYRGFEGVAEEWEWEPSLLAVRRELEAALLAGLREVAGTKDAPVDVVGGLYELAAGAGRSLSAFLAAEGTVEQMREFAVHRSAYQLKEADPHTWAIPRLTGGVKAAMVEVQADEYGEGRERDMHQNLFALTMRAIGLDGRYGAYLDLLPAETLAAVNLISFFGLHRRWRGALVGHLALFEMTSVEPMGRYSQALRRLGFGSAARHFFEVHVVADAHHERVAAHNLAGGLAAQDPRLSTDILFGARCAVAVEGAFSDAVLDAWEQGRTSLRSPLRLPTDAPVLA
jgi:hypothetical protein